MDAEVERLSDTYSAALERIDRHQAVIQAMKLLSERAVYFPLYYGYDVLAHTGSLVGPRGARQDNALWKIETWYWKDGPPPRRQ